MIEDHFRTGYSVKTYLAQPTLQSSAFLATCMQAGFY